MLKDCKIFLLAILVCCVALMTSQITALGKQDSEAKQETSKAQDKEKAKETSPASEENKSSIGDSLKSIQGKDSAGLDGLKSMSIGNLQEALFSVGGMASMDGFPPFFGDSAPQQPSAPQSTPSPSILGTWSASTGQQTVTMIFHQGGSFTIIDNGQKVDGSYEVRGNQLLLRLNNGKLLNLQFSIQGDYLAFSDGSRFLRQSSAPQQQLPQQQPMPQTQNSTNQGLEGIWAAGDGTTNVIMMFMNGICGLNINGRQDYGPYTVQGNRLHVQFTNIKPLDLTFTLQGNTLRFSDGTVLLRQQMPNMPIGNQPMPQPQQPAPNPMPQQSSSATPLEGAWAAQLPNGANVGFIFKGNQYIFLANGQQVETGIFTLNGNRLEYTITSGQATGSKGVNTWQINGNVLIIMTPNGAHMQLQRRQ